MMGRRIFWYIFTDVSQKFYFVHFRVDELHKNFKCIVLRLPPYNADINPYSANMENMASS